jgi:hypothetical protein
MTRLYHFFVLFPPLLHSGDPLSLTASLDSTPDHLEIRSNVSSMFSIVSPMSLVLFCDLLVALFQKEKAAKKKDPNAPKKALSPYMFFTQEHREIIKEENPGIGFGTSPPTLLHVFLRIHPPPGEVAKKLGAKWKSMTDEDKEVRAGSIPILHVICTENVHSLTSRSIRPIRSAPKRPRRLMRCVSPSPLSSNNTLTPLHSPSQRPLLPPVETTMTSRVDDRLKDGDSQIAIFHRQTMLFISALVTISRLFFRLNPLQRPPAYPTLPYPNPPLFPEDLQYSAFMLAAFIPTPNLLFYFFVVYLACFGDGIFHYFLSIFVVP